MSHFNHKGRPGLVGGSLPKGNLQDLFLILKGSSRSGNYGHVGRPGKKGGSGISTSIKLRRDSEKIISEVNSLRKKEGLSEISGDRKEKYKDLLNKGLSSIDSSALSNDDILALDILKNNSGSIEDLDKKVLDAVKKSKVVKPMTVWRAQPKNKYLWEDKVSNFSLDKNVSRRMAEEDGWELLEVALQPGDSAFFVPSITNNHVNEMEVLVVK